MPNLNKVMIIGNLTRDPDGRPAQQTQSPISRLSVAVNRKWQERSGQQREEVTFVECTAWGNAASFCNQYLRKGSSVFIEGRLKLDRWQAQDGSNRQKLSVVVEKIQGLDKPPPQPGQHEYYEQQQQPAPSGKYGDSFEDNNVPF